MANRVVQVILDTLQKWTASDTLVDPDGNAVYTAGNPPPQDPPLGSATPLVESGAGSVGVSTNASREDHVHPAGGGSPLPVSGLKGATVVASGSVALGGGGAASINIEAGTALRYYLFGVYWAGGNNVAFSASIGARLGFSTLYFPALAVAVTAGYKVYRVDET
jgi:hypothetical protein